MIVVRFLRDDHKKLRSLGFRSELDEIRSSKLGTINPLFFPTLKLVKKTQFPIIQVFLVKVGNLNLMSFLKLIFLQT